MFNFNFGGFGGYSYADSELYTSGGATISTNNIKELNVNWIAGSVSVTTHSGDDIIISENCDSTLNAEETLCYYVNNDGVLFIKYWKPKSWTFRRLFSPEKHLTVSVPEKDTDLFEKLKIDVVSARINTNEISADEISLNSVSGSINATPKEKSDKIIAESVSGEIQIEAITEWLKMKSVSGEMTFNGEVKKIECDNVSGEIDLIVDKCPDSLDVKEVSGSVTLTLPENDGFTAKYNSVSGDFNCEFTVTGSKKTVVYKDGNAEINFDTISGDIDIKKK